jgi:hypothetical protein
MAFTSPIPHVCEVCIEELLKYRGIYSIGEDFKCWNCGMRFTMEKIDSEKLDDPFDALSFCRLKDGSLRKFDRSAPDVNIKVVKLWGDLTEVSVQEIYQFCQEKGLEVPANQKIDKFRNVVVFDNDTCGFMSQGRYFSPLRPGLLAQLEI